MKFIKLFNEIDLTDVHTVGGKNASLGQLTKLAQTTHIHVPTGFATTSNAYRHFMRTNNLEKPVNTLLTAIPNPEHTNHVIRASKRIRALIEHGHIPADLAQEIIDAYHQLGTTKNARVAIRSSATAEDLPYASFAGQHESFLYISGDHAVLKYWLTCVSSLFTPRAIVYRMLNHIAHERVAMAVGIQHIITAQCAGVAFTLDPESGFRDVVCINATYGLGESIVQGKVNPDEYYVHKERLVAGFEPILTKTCGNKQRIFVYAHKKIVQKNASPKLSARFCLSDRLILELARQCITIEKSYSTVYGRHTPMDIEWVIDAHNKFSIVQARPETIHGTHKQVLPVYTVDTRCACALLTGQAIGQKSAQGRVYRCNTIKQAAAMPTGAVLVTRMTNPDWVPIMKKAAAIITDNGGRTCHAAIVSRELGIPAIVGTIHATKTLKHCGAVTIDCGTGSTGTIYRGMLPIKRTTISYQKLRTPPVPIMLNISIPTQAFTLAPLPVTGVGLARTEFIIARAIQVHPLAALAYKKLDRSLRKKIAQLCAAYQNPQEFFVAVLAQECATIAAAFWPKPVYVRFSDFKTNEYCDLLGGSCFEPQEENPMLGKRGAFRYYTPPYNKAFALECAAIKRARTIKGFTNIHVMVPMIRSAHEAETIHELLKKYGLLDTHPRMNIIAMCEVPACALALDAMCRFVDGFSIGSNDLTQFVLAADRDDPVLAATFNEQNTVVRELMAHAIKRAHACKKPIGICGQGPSDDSQLRTWLIAQHIDYISLNPDAIVTWLIRV